MLYNQLWQKKKRCIHFVERIHILSRFILPILLCERRAREQILTAKYNCDCSPSFDTCNYLLTDTTSILRTMRSEEWCRSSNRSFLPRYLCARCQIKWFPWSRHEMTSTRCGDHCNDDNRESGINCVEQELTQATLSTSLTPCILSWIIAVLEYFHKSQHATYCNLSHEELYQRRVTPICDNCYRAHLSYILIYLLSDNISYKQLDPDCLTGKLSWKSNYQFKKYLNMNLKIT